MHVTADERAAMSLLDEVRKLEQHVLGRLKELEPLTREYEQLRKVAERLGLKYTPTASEADTDQPPPSTPRRRAAKAHPPPAARKPRPPKSPPPAHTRPGQSQPIVAQAGGEALDPTARGHDPRPWR